MLVLALEIKISLNLNAFHVVRVFKLAQLAH
jgi:hypothetical protein